MLNRGKCGARDFFGGDVDEFRGAVAFGAGTGCDFGELGVNRAGTKRTHSHAGATQFRPDRFGETGDVGFRRGVNRKPCDGQEARRGKWPIQFLFLHLSSREVLERLEAGR